MYYYSPRYGQRPGIMDAMGCLNKWVKIQFNDGTVLQAYLNSLDFSYVGGFIPRNSYKSLTCQGTLIQNEQQASTCLNQWVQIELPNGVNLSMYMTSFDNQYVGGSMQTSELLGLSDQITGIEC